MKLSKLKPVCGIYKITNLKNGRIYIGQSRNVQVRWANHVNQLVSGSHSNSKLLQDFKEYGIKAFEVEVIEKHRSDKNLLAREEFYILQCHRQGYSLYNRIPTERQQPEPQKPWAVGWKPIDNATAKPKWSGIQFDSFAEASRAVQMLNSTDPESHYFATLNDGDLD
jgi:hypothetical protein